MLHEANLAFIGGGIMAEAMIQGVLRQGLLPPNQIIASGPREKRREELAQRYGIGVTVDNREVVRVGDIVVLSVKPQVLPKVLPELRGLLRSEQLVLSIVAGARIAAIAAGLELERVFTSSDLVRGGDVFFAVTGITDGELVRGVRYFADGARTHSIVMR